METQTLIFLYGPHQRTPMDLSSLPEAEQQKLRQLQIQFQEHQAQQQQQEAQQQQEQHQQNQDQNVSQAYDPSQYQPYYDQSSQAYGYSQYQYYPQEHHHHQEQHFDQHYAYYQSDYANTYHQQQYVPPDPAQSSAATAAELVPVQQQNVYYQTPPVPEGGGEQQSAAAYPSLNAAAAAAVAALSQLTHLAGTMDAAERALAGAGQFMGHGLMPPPVGLSPYRGGGRRGGRSFKGGGRGSLGNRSGGSCPPFLGRGRGRGRRGPMQFTSHVKPSTSSHSEPTATEDAELVDEAGTSANAPEIAAVAATHPETSLATSSAGKVAASRKPKQAAWCGLCRVDCTSLEMLEQHKNGKKHKKNMLKIEELKNVVVPGPAVQNEQKLIVESNPVASEHPETAQNGDENSNKPIENLTLEAGAEQNQPETKQPNQEESSDMQTTKLKTDRFDNNRRGTKRKMRGGRGGKRVKTFESLRRRPVEPPKPKVVIPLVCELCNVKCDTQEVLDHHLNGKKHISKLKRFQGHHALYGPMGLQTLYPPNPQVMFHPPSHQQHFYAPQSSYPPPGAYSVPHPPPAAGIGPQFDQNPMPHGTVAIPEAQQQLATAPPHIM